CNILILAVDASVLPPFRVAGRSGKQPDFGPLIGCSGPAAFRPTCLYPVADSGAWTGQPPIKVQRADRMDKAAVFRHEESNPGTGPPVSWVCGALTEKT